LSCLHSKETDGKLTDREVIDAALLPLVKSVAAEITNNFSLRPIYKRIFIQTASVLFNLLNSWKYEEIIEKFSFEPAMIELARAIYEIGEKHGYEGAYLGEFKYAISQFIRMVPQEKVKRGDWEPKSKSDYWLYVETIVALIHASRLTEDLGIGVDGVFINTKDDYKLESA